MAERTEESVSHCWREFSALFSSRHVLRIKNHTVISQPLFLRKLHATMERRNITSPSGLVTRQVRGSSRTSLWFYSFLASKMHKKIIYPFWQRYSKWKLPFLAKLKQFLIREQCFDWLSTGISRLIGNVAFQVCICFLTRHSPSFHFCTSYIPWDETLHRLK